MQLASKVKKKATRGQTALETVFVFSMLLFIAFAMVNFGIKYHTHNIANYAAFMAARSYQVIGSGEGSEFFEEMDANGGTQEFLKELRDKEVLSVQVVAEDIFTCALPWIRVPEGDGASLSFGDDQDKIVSQKSHCQEGQRQYKEMNIGDENKLTFSIFGESSGFGGLELASVPGAFAENERAGLRYGVLSLKYRTPILMDPFGAFTKNQDDPYIYGEVSTPVLLNPGLEAGISSDPVDEDESVRDAFKKK